MTTKLFKTLVAISGIMVALVISYYTNVPLDLKDMMTYLKNKSSTSSYI